MTPVSPQWEPRVVPVLLLVVLAVVGGVRAVDLARHGWTPSGHNEAKWFGWAWGQPAERELIPNPFRVDPSRLGLSPGDEVFLVVDTPRLRAGWLHVMSQYALPAQPVVGTGDAETARKQAEEVHLLRVDGPEEPLAAAVSAEAGTGPWQRLGALAGGLGVTLLLGAALLRRPAGWTRQPATEAALAFAAGAVPYTLLTVGVLGVGLSGAWTPAAALGLAAATAVWWRRRASEPPAWTPPAEASPRGAWADAVWIALTGLFVVRIAMTPLWSWDHFAIWGTKARRIAATGLGSDVLAPGSGTAFVYSTPHYPFGVPLLEAGLASGLVPGGWLFRTLHLVWGVGLVILVRRASRSLGASRLAAAAAAALVAASPLLMDTESLGLAEMPLAFWSVAAVVLAVDATERRWPRGWPLGLVFGFLIWIKQDAWVLAVFLGLVLLLLPVLKRRRAAFLVTVAGLAVACAAVQAWIGEEGRSFFVGDPLSRVVDRLPRALEILSHGGSKLLAAEWLGFWLLLPVGLVVAWGRQRWAALGLGLGVLAQVLVYVGVYFASYPEPLQHIDSSFFRIAAALVPLGAVALAAAWGGWSRQEASNASGTGSSGSSSLSPTFLA